jgi:RimJ/RimL family protein N-acetyltransferase
MTREAHLRRDWPEADGNWTDSLIYGLLREEWPRG